MGCGDSVNLKFSVSKCVCGFFLGGGVGVGGVGDGEKGLKGKFLMRFVTVTEEFACLGWYEKFAWFWWCRGIDLVIHCVLQHTEVLQLQISDSKPADHDRLQAGCFNLDTSNLQLIKTVLLDITVSFCFHALASQSWCFCMKRLWWIKKQTKKG